MSLKDDIELFWKEVYILSEKSKDLGRIRTLARFFNHIMVVSASTSPVERLFSSYNLQKTDLRANLDLGTIESLLWIKYFYKEVMKPEPLETMYKL